MPNFILTFVLLAGILVVLGVPREGLWQEVLNSDAELYGGSGWGNLGGVQAAPVGAHGQRFSLSITLPPLSVVYFRGPIDG